MNRVPWSILLALAACTGVRGPICDADPSSPRAAAAVDAEVAAPAARGTAPATPAQTGGNLTDEERDIFASDDFRRRLAESYLSERDIEPELKADELEAYRGIVTLVTQDRLADAEAQVRAYLVANPSCSARFDLALGNVHMQRGEYEAAASAFALAVQKHPKFRAAWGNLARVRFQLGQYDEAATAFARVVATGGGDASVYGMLGISHGKRGDLLGAESAFRIAAALAPDVTNWKLVLLDVLLGQGRYADAVALAGDLVDENPGVARYWLLQGEALVKLDRAVEAAQSFEMAVELGAATPAVLLNLGDIYAFQGLMDLAVARYLRAYEVEPATPLDRPLRTAPAMIGADPDQALKLVAGLEAAQGDRLTLEHRKALAWLRARIAVAKGEGGEEVRILEEIVALDPLDGATLVLLGDHWRRNGDADKALACYAQAAQIEAAEPDALVGRAQVFVNQRRYADAVPLLQRAQTLKPRDRVQSYLEQVQRMQQGR